MYEFDLLHTRVMVFPNFRSIGSYAEIVMQNLKHQHSDCTHTTKLKFSR